MKLLKTLIIAFAFTAASAYAEPQPAGITCEQLGEEFQSTPEAQARFADLKGTCAGVYTINNSLYTRSKAVFRGYHAGKANVYLPATDHTFQVETPRSRTVNIAGRDTRVGDMVRGQEFDIYLSVDKFASERLDQISFDAIEFVIIEEISALPTTASPLPLLAILSGLFLSGGLILRSRRRKA